MILYIIWGVCLLLALHLYLKSIYSRFSKYGVKNPKTLPFLGNSYPVVFKQKHISDAMNDLYTMYPEERFVGNFNFMDPGIILTDLELIKKITIKDYEYFIDHKRLVDENADPFFGRNLLSLKGEEWKDMRSTLSPAFTSSKIRSMVPFMNEVGANMVLSLTKSLKEAENEYVDIDVKDLCTRFANDVIASCAFGLKVNSYNDRNNEFYKMGEEVSTFKFWKIVQFLFYMAFPSLTKKLKLDLFSKTCKDFFQNLVLNTMKDRELKNITRLDMIHLLMEAKKGQLTHDSNSTKDADAGFATVEESTVGKKKIDRVWSDIDLIAQALLFLIAGFETVSTAMGFLLHELAINPEVQEKLLREIKEIDAATGGKLTYDTIQKMTYMDMVVSEMLRLWTPSRLIDRLCVKDYNLGRPNEKATQDFIIRKGETVGITIFQIHRDPKYFPDPLKFDPERFSEENKHNIKPFTYMPFGVGPRNCIGSRFALCEIKIFAYHLIKHFEVSLSPKTMIPVKLSLDTFTVRIKDGLWVHFKIRENGKR